MSNIRKGVSPIGCSILVTLVGWVLGVSQVWAETAQATNEVVEEIVVTAVPRGATKLESSVSVSSLTAEDVYEVAPRSVAEIFRSLPGIRAESSGGNGNANITVRGIPLATGGSKYMQLWEDGLPVVEFGDINFANGDNFIRYDWSIDRIESIRGGSASTFASNSPGGVINLISKTGKEEGGSVGLTFGADFDQTRTDFEYGGSLTDSLRYHVAGYFRDGEGIRDTGFDGDSGGQIKLNITKEFDAGFFRVYLKHLDDRVTTYLPAPVKVNGGDSFDDVPNFDASSETLHSALQTSISTFDAFGNRKKRDVTDGIESLVDAFGFEFDVDVGDGWILSDKFRNSDIEGGFISPFTDTFGIGIVPAQQWGDQLCAASSDVDGNPATGCTGTSVTYANGPNAGQVYDGLAFPNLLFDTTFNDVGLLVNDLQLSKEFNNVTVTVGYYRSKQNIDIDWNSWQFILQEVNGNNAANLNVVSTTGELITENGLFWPGLLSFSWDLQYQTSAPYINVAFDLDRFSFDLSARRDEVEARGEAIMACCGAGAGQVIDINNDGTISVAEARGVAIANQNAGTNLVDYDADNTSFSIGGTFLIDDDSSAFARYSQGGRAVADRLLQIANTLNPDGSLAPGNDGYDDVDQLEVGYKRKAGNIDVFATYFYTTTEETNAEITSGTTFQREYEAQGVELEGNWQITDEIFVKGNVTWTDAEISKDKNNPAVEGNTPRRQADFIWTISPQYRTDRFAFGATIQGSTEYYVQDSNQLKQEAYNIIDLFGQYYVTDQLALSFTVNNLTDEFIVTEVEEASANVGDLVRGRPLSGRSSTVSLRYEF